MFGTLEPVPSGIPIPLLKKRLRIGRRDGCDIVLESSRVSGHHALLELEEGYWFIRDLRSRNGIRVGGKRILSGLRKRLDPNEIFAISNNQFAIRYDPDSLGAYGTPPPDEQLVDLFRDSLRGGGPAGATKGIRPRDGPRDYPPMGGTADPPE